MDRTLTLVIGAQRSGKSFFIERYIRDYYLKFGGMGLIYNLGKPTDFNSAIPIELLNYREHSSILGKNYKSSPYFEFYRHNKEVKDFSNVNFEFYKKSIKTTRLSARIERLFFESFYYYVSNTCLVIDDCRPIFRNGLKEEFIQIFARLNHCGIKHKAPEWEAKGVDVILVFHSLDLVNAELFDYATHILNFRYANAPDFKRIENVQLRDQLKQSFDYLQKAPKYSYTNTSIHKLKTDFYKP